MVGGGAVGRRERIPSPRLSPPERLLQGDWPLNIGGDSLDCRIAPSLIGYSAGSLAAMVVSTEAVSTNSIAPSPPPVGSLMVTVNVSAGSDRSSSVTASVKVTLVSPDGMVTVPERPSDG